MISKRNRGLSSQHFVTTEFNLNTAKNIFSIYKKKQIKEKPQRKTSRSQHEYFAKQKKM